MDNKKLLEIFEGILRVDREVRYSHKSNDPDCYAGIYKKANTTREAPNSLKVNEALLIMLKVVHSFKYFIDSYWEELEEHDANNYNKEIENIINNRPLEVKERFSAINYGQLFTLLLMVLYDLNGAHFRINDRDYAWEDELDEILKLPNWSYELDSEITKFLLLPLYYETHHHLDENE